MTRTMIALALAAVDCAVCLALGLPAVVAASVAGAAFVIATMAMSVVSSSEDRESDLGAVRLRDPMTEPDVFRDVS